MIGIELKTSELAQSLVKACFNKGLIVLGCGHKAVRFPPPLVIGHEDADLALGVLEAALNEVAHGG